MMPSMPGDETRTRLDYSSQPTRPTTASVAVVSICGCPAASVAAILAVQVWQRRAWPIPAGPLAFSVVWGTVIGVTAGWVAWRVAPKSSRQAFAVLGLLCIAVSGFASGSLFLLLGDAIGD
jgi:hypothetical protein